MTQGFYSAISGVQANQLRLNVISNNIANVNTIGYKSSNAHFATVFSNTISGGTAPTGTLGGTNPRQVGVGVQVTEIPANFNQGGTQFTGRSTDFMINGNGFFAVERVDQNLGAVSSSFYLTRAGNFSLDSGGNMVTASGNRVRGTSQMSGSNPITLNLINIPQDFLIVKDLDVNGATIGTHFAQVGTDPADIAAVATTGTNTQNIATVKVVQFTVGNDGAITATYSNGDRVSVRTDGGTVSPTDPTTARREIIHLPAEGGTFGADNDGDGVSSQTTDRGIVSQVNNVFTAAAGGNPLEGSQLQIQMATVTNPGGLLYDGSNNFLAGANSGQTFFGTPGNENRGNIQSGALESSNVDLSNEFTNLIITQRGLEANSKVIRTQSEVLQTIINIVN